MFAVGKGEFKSAIETQRLIMNLVPVNQICKPLQGDVGTLPAVSGLSGFLLGSGEVALLSSEDIKCFSTCSRFLRRGRSTWDSTKLFQRS